MWVMGWPPSHGLPTALPRADDCRRWHTVPQGLVTLHCICIDVAIPGHNC